MTNPDALARLRELRSHHWRELIKARHNAQRAATGSQAMRYHEDANTHLRFVQTLNDYFEAGDTAEADAR